MATVSLSDIAEIVMGQSPAGETCNLIGEGLPLLNGPTEFGSYHPLPQQYTSDARKRAAKGDLLFCVRGSTTGKMNWADREYAIGRGLAAIRHKKGSKYQPLLRAFIEYRLPVLLQSATGSTFPNVSLSQLEELQCEVFSDENEKSIAYIFGLLERKIYLNRSMNETLEAIARAIFQSWFVDFDPVRAKAEGRKPFGMDRETAALFSDSFDESELGQIPKGWSILPFADTVEICGGGTPKTSVPEYWGGNIPWFSVADAPSDGDVFVIDTEKKITDEGLEKSSTVVLPEGTTIITARGTVGKVALVGVPMAMNQSCYGLRGRHKGRKGAFTYFSTLRLVSTLKQHAHGSVFDTITRDTFAGVKVAMPHELLILAFEENIAPLLEHIRLNCFESRTLSTLRNTLLTKLLSGELTPTLVA